LRQKLEEAQAGAAESTQRAFSAERRVEAIEVHVCTHTYIHMHVYIYTHTHTHTYTHTHTEREREREREREQEARGESGAADFFFDTQSESKKLEGIVEQLSLRLENNLKDSDASKAQLLEARRIADANNEETSDALAQARRELKNTQVCKYSIYNIYSAVYYMYTMLSS
jgi:hypothetical protein